MKRSFAIIGLFIGLNLIIFWITSVPGSKDAGTDPIDDIVEPREQKTLLVPDESANRSRSLLLGDVAEIRRARTFSGEPFQSAVADVIPSLARLQILYREEGEWVEESTAAVCIDPDGFFLAPWNRVTQGELFRLHFQDGRLAEARLDSMDPATRLALIECLGGQEVYKPVPFGAGLSASFGQPLLFLWLNEDAQPRAQEGRLNGVVYQQPRSFPEAFSGYLQSDILVEPEQSGGVLVDMGGRLLGMLVSDVTASSRDFAPMLAAEEIRFVVRQLRQKGFVSRSSIGVDVQALDPTLQELFGISETQAGILVSRVYPESPAARAGIRSGDLITQISGRPVASSDFFSSMISRWPGEKEVPITISRGEATLELSPIAEASPRVDPSIAFDADLSLPTISDSPEGPFWTLEDRKINLYGELAAYAVITAIEPARCLFVPPLQKGDVLLQVNEVEYPQAATARDVIRQLDGDSPILLRVYRDGRAFWSVARPL